MLIFTPGDASKTPLVLRKRDGSPLANPVQTNESGFGSDFISELHRVAWQGGNYGGFFTSYEGMMAAALAAAAAAEATAMPLGGAVGQTLTKVSGANYDAAWSYPIGGGGGSGGLHWDGTNWQARDGSPTSCMYWSTKDPNAPQPTDMLPGDTWLRHPDALEPA